MALLIGRAPCVIGTMSDRDAFEKIYYIYLNFFKPLFHNRKKFYRSTGIVAGMSSLLVVFLLLVYWDSGWYGVPYFRCRPRVCVSPPPPPTWWYAWPLIDDEYPWYLIEVKNKEKKKIFERQFFEMIRDDSNFFRAESLLFSLVRIQFCLAHLLKHMILFLLL